MHSFALAWHCRGGGAAAALVPIGSATAAGIADLPGVLEGVSSIVPAIHAAEARAAAAAATQLQPTPVPQHQPPPDVAASYLKTHVGIGM